MDESGTADARVEPGRPPAPPEPLRVGLDLGRHATRIACRSPEDEGAWRVVSEPSLLGYSLEEALPIRFSCAGRKALDRRDHLRLVKPLEAPDDEDGVLEDFARHLREWLPARGDRALWGVVNCAGGVPDEEARRRRTIANALFDRVALADDIFLVALGLGSHELSSHSILLDLGAGSIRAALMHGETPSSEERTTVDFGGARLDDALRRSISFRYPELLLTEWTLAEIKRALAFVPPTRRQATIELRYRGAVRTLDFTETMQEACDALVPPVLRAARVILARCPSDDIERFQKNIILVGGCAALPGLVERVESELRADGFEHARVSLPENPEELVARGAAAWAGILRERDWNIPLFSFSQG